MCEMACQIIQKKQKEKQIKEEQAAKAQNSKIPVCYDDDDDYNSAITPNEPVDSLSIGDEHLGTIPATESNEFIKSCVENLVPNPSESEGENGCDVPACFTTFSNILFDADYESGSQEIIPMKIDQHHFNAESDLIESMLNHESSIIPSSSKIDSLLDEFAGELTLLKSIPSGIDETDCHPETEIRFSERLLYDNLSTRPPKVFVYENSDAEIESFSPSPIPNEDNDSFMEEIDLSFNSDDLVPPGIEEDDDDSERDMLIHKELLDNYSLSLPVIESFYFDIPSFSRPPTKPPDDSYQRILSAKSLFPQLQLGIINILVVKIVGLLMNLTIANQRIMTIITSKILAMILILLALTMRLLYDNSSPHPPEEFVSENSDAEIESFSSSPILNKDSNSFIEEIDLFLTLDNPMPPSIEDDDDDSERDILILEELPSNYSLSLPVNESFYFDIPSFFRPPTKPPDGNTGILNIKMMGDISDQKYSRKCEDSCQRILSSKPSFP
uniref:Reverse transcriptase domain-containing protein n=1 Tax=Tanacetum cinerariifolium TaxID=118510 RepID=A0A6L2LG75_TANCI|nr:hypothetical protein [Tanacetum cinerariifolium]